MKKGATSEGLVYHAGFPNAGEDQHGQNLSLDKLVIQHRASTYFWRLEQEIPLLGWKADSIVVVDRAAVPTTSRLSVVVVDDDFVVARMRDNHFVDLSGHRLDESVLLWGVITHCVQSYL
ncbi:MAG: hypothetical protein ABIQ64_03585 [Candidatus Saccharimonadales bacterium]